MKKILISLSMLAAVAVVVVGATTAFFSDTETSTGNTFTAGAIDLKVDSEAHYNGLICQSSNNSFQWLQPVGDPIPNPAPEHYGQSCNGTWSENNLGTGVEWRFFNFADLKPGDEGENTISLHVYDNDAWGRLLISTPVETENLCTEPEDDVDTTCSDPDGELRENTNFMVWLDQGAIPGFQCNDPSDTSSAGARCLEDRTEGNNIQDGQYEGTLISSGTIDVGGEEWSITDGLSAVRATLGSACATADPDGNGNTNYGTCHGLATDGRMVGSTTYYFGVGWEIPSTVNNVMQTDGMTANMTFEVEQYRNNPSPSWD